MVYHFTTELKKYNIESIANKFGFTNPLYVEKFIMDFEMNYHISQKIDCLLRGGMCMPFHSELKVRRLSIDIDLLTNLNVNKIDEIMNDIDNRLPDVKIKMHKPKNPYPIPNLVSYYVEYDSCFGGTEFIKIDYLCDFSLKLPTQTISNTQEIIEFKIDYPAKILTRGAIIGDKITTLALGKIGLNKSKFYDIPKQIYDISTLLKVATENDISESLAVFETLTKFKVKIFKNGLYTIDEIINGIYSSIHSLFSFKSALTIEKNYEGFFGSFTGTYLNTVQSYKKTQHISDILLVWSYGTILKKFIANSISKQDASGKIFSIVKSYDDISNSSNDEKEITRKNLFNNISKFPFDQKILKGSPVEQVFIINEIFSK